MTLSNTAKMAAILLLLGGGRAVGQAGPSFNREVLRLGVGKGSASGLFDIHVAWEFQVGPTETMLDLGTTVQVSVEGVTVGQMNRSLIVDTGSGTCGSFPLCQDPCGDAPFCEDPCGSATTDEPFTLYCDLTTCECSSPGSLWVRPDPQGDETVDFEDLTLTVADVPLLVGDGITVILTPATGALPDSDTSDDTRTITFLGLDPRPGDSDGDDDGDMLDYLQFQLCFGQSGVITPECTFADLNEDRFIDLGDYDGFDITGPIFPCQTIGLALNWPFAGQDAAEWVVNSYRDLDPADGSACNPGVEDYMGGGKTYDGHNSVDILVPSFRAMDNGVLVLAAQEGRVVGDLVDDVYDRNTSWANGGTANQVSIEHANGFTTGYFHFKQFSILVTLGEWVQAGQPLAVVGSSGTSSTPHLHFSVKDCDGNKLSSFGEGMWLNPPVYNTPLGFMELWLKDGLIDDESDTKDPGPDAESLSPNSFLGIGLVTGGGQPGDVLEIKIWRGDGTLWGIIDNTWKTEQCRALERWRWNPFIDNVTGTWTVEVWINGALKESKDFTVSN